MPINDTENPIVFFDIQIAGQPAGRIKMELFKNIAPKTAENFRQFCTGEYKENNVPLGYKNTLFHRVVKEFIIQGGDFVNRDGTGVKSIYNNGGVFEDENFTLKHDSAGLLSSANAGKDQNGCQFFITCEACPWLDGKNVVFGRVIEGMLVVRKIENVAVGLDNKPKHDCVIVECGEL